MHILRTNIQGNPNVGMYGYATGEYVLLGEEPNGKAREELHEVLGGLPVHHVRIAGTPMPGLFLAGNSNALLVPSIAFDEEVGKLKEIGLPVHVLETLQTCLGNNICCNDHGAVLSTDFTEKEAELISQALGVPAVRIDIAGMTTPGAFIVLNGEHGVIHRDATDEEIERIGMLLKAKLTPATVNLGTPYLRAGILASPHGFVCGQATGGPEVVHLDESLGYAEEE